MIYIDFFIKETQERHFYKFEGDSLRLQNSISAEIIMNGLVVNETKPTQFQLDLQ